MQRQRGVSSVEHSKIAHISRSIFGCMPPLNEQFCPRPCSWFFLLHLPLLSSQHRRGGWQPKMYECPVLQMQTCLQRSSGKISVGAAFQKYTQSAPKYIQNAPKSTQRPRETACGPADISKSKMAEIVLPCLEANPFFQGAILTACMSVHTIKLHFRCSSFANLAGGRDF